MRARPVFLPKLGGYLRSLRESRGWNQLQTVDMARRRRVTLSYNTLRWIEDGKIKNPEPEALKAMSVLYGVSYEDLVSSYARERFGFQRGSNSEPESAKDSIAVPVLSTPLSRQSALVIEPNVDGADSLVFGRDFLKTFTRPIVLRVGLTEASMTPTIEPGDVVLIDQNVSRRRRPRAGDIYVIHFPALADADGSGLRRVKLSGRTLILSADNPDKSGYPIHTFEIKAATLPDVLVGQVVWVGRALTPGPSR